MPEPDPSNRPADVTPQPAADANPFPKFELPQGSTPEMIDVPNGPRYKGLSHKAPDQDGAVPAEEVWIRFNAEGADKIPKTGWKIHVSAKTPEAQKALAEIAMKYGIVTFKLHHDPGVLQNPKSLQRGKTAVFYHTETGVDGRKIDWQAFAAEAEAAVAKHGGPGEAVVNDKRVPGSKALFYRHDEGVELRRDPETGKLTKYVSNSDLPRYARKFGISEE
ncbi:MAG: hypothetical protein K2Q01_04050, partial [Rickettsiales bacterium]|nr:hypothetical protein [Rickettsiales bacterium]